MTLLSSLEGNWKAGREYSDRGLELAPLSQPSLVLRFLLEHETGEYAQGEVYREQLLEARSRWSDFRTHGRTSMAITAVARITGVADPSETAQAATEAVLEEQSAAPTLAMYAKAGLALLAVQEGDQSVAAEHHADLLGQRGTMIWTVSSADRLRGLLSQTMGNMDQAAAHFEDAWPSAARPATGPS